MRSRFEREWSSDAMPAIEKAILLIGFGLLVERELYDDALQHEIGYNVDVDGQGRTAPEDLYTHGGRTAKSEECNGAFQVKVGAVPIACKR